MGFWVLMIGKLKGILACIEVKTLKKVAFTKLAWMRKEEN